MIDDHHSTPFGPVRDTDTAGYSSGISSNFLRTGSAAWWGARRREDEKEYEEERARRREEEEKKAKRARRRKKEGKIGEDARSRAPDYSSDSSSFVVGAAAAIIGVFVVTAFAVTALQREANKIPPTAASIPDESFRTTSPHYAFVTARRLNLLSSADQPVGAPLSCGDMVFAPNGITTGRTRVGGITTAFESETFYSHNFYYVDSSHLSLIRPRPDQCTP